MKSITNGGQSQCLLTDSVTVETAVASVPASNDTVTPFPPRSVDPTPPSPRATNSEGLPVRVQFVITRPPQVRLFTHAITHLVADGHRVALSVRESAETTTLLAQTGFEYTALSGASSSRLLSGLQSLEWTAKLSRYARRFEPDVIVGERATSLWCAANAANARLVLSPSPTQPPMAGSATGPNCRPESTDSGISLPAPTATDGGGQGSLALYGAAAQYHPDWFTPNSAVRERHGVDTADSYSVVQFTAKAGHHNPASRGLDRQTKQQLVGSLSEAGEVYVGNTDDLHPALSGRRIRLPPAETTPLLDGASLCVTDEPDLAVASCLCGTPTVYLHVSQHELPALVAELAEQKLVVVATDDDAARSAVDRLLAEPERESIWDRRTARLFTAIGDPTAELLKAVSEAPT